MRCAHGGLQAKSTLATTSCAGARARWLALPPPPPPCPTHVHWRPDKAECIGSAAAAQELQALRAAPGAGVVAEAGAASGGSPAGAAAAAISAASSSALRMVTRILVTVKRGERGRGGRREEGRGKVAAVWRRAPLCVAAARAEAARAAVARQLRAAALGSQPPAPRPPAAGPPNPWNAAVCDLSQWDSYSCAQGGGVLPACRGFTELGVVRGFMWCLVSQNGRFVRNASGSARKPPTRPRPGWS